MITGHTASDVPLSASGPGAWQFTGVFENSDVFLEDASRASTGAAARGQVSARAQRATARETRRHVAQSTACACVPVR